MYLPPVCFHMKGKQICKMSNSYMPWNGVAACIRKNIRYFALFSPVHLCINQVCIRVPSSGMLCHAALVRTDILEEHIISNIRVTRIIELGRN
jgi:hypothetical protein